ncbi:MAG: prenyltransferase/squalene oxidase repeat-containing protein [Candidatus Bathyarchaeia archaeon]
MRYPSTRKRGKLSTILTVALIFSMFAPALAYPHVPSDPVVAKARDFLKSAQQSDGNIGGFTVSAWAVMAIASLGEDPHSWKRNGGPSIVDYLKVNAHLVDETKATDVERYILAMTSAGENPRNIGGKDYVAILDGLYDGIQIGDPNLLNDDFWGVLALISAGEPFNSAIIQNTVAFIKSRRNSDGGWGWGVGVNSDVDDTAAAIMALIAAKEPANSQVIVNALSYIKSKQMNNGGFEAWGSTNPGTDAWGICAIAATGQNPTSTYWTKNDKTPVDDLLTFQGDDGAFSFPDSNPRKEWATSYALVALLGKPYPVKPVTQKVGGIIIPLNKFKLLTSLIFLVSAILVMPVVAISAKHRKRR